MAEKVFRMYIALVELRKECGMMSLRICKSETPAKMSALWLYALHNLETHTMEFV